MEQRTAKELVDLIWSPTYNKEEISGWSRRVKKLAEAIIKDSTLLGARHWHLARDIERALVGSADSDFLRKVKLELTGYLVAQEDYHYSARFTICQEMMQLVAPPLDTRVPSNYKNTRWSKAWQNFTTMSSAPSGFIDEPLGEHALMVLSFYLLGRESDSASQLSQRQVDEYVRATFASEHARRVAIAVNCNHDEPTLEASLEALKTWCHENSDHLATIMRSLGYSVTRL